MDLYSLESNFCKLYVESKTRWLDHTFSRTTERVAMKIGKQLPWTLFKKRFWKIHSCSWKWPVKIIFYIYGILIILKCIRKYPWQPFSTTRVPFSQQCIRCCQGVGGTGMMSEVVKGEGVWGAGWVGEGLTREAISNYDRVFCVWRDATSHWRCQWNRYLLLSKLSWRMKISSLCVKFDIS